MAKRRHQETETSSSRMTLAIMAFGAVLVAALIVWALTRPVEPATTVLNAPDTGVPPVSPQVTEPLSTATAPTATGPIATPPMTTAADAPQVVPPRNANTDEAAVPRMAVEDLRPKMQRGEVTVVDVRDPAAFTASHIPGAINIPFSRVEGELDRLPKDKPIVTYCT